MRFEFLCQVVVGPENDFVFSKTISLPFIPFPGMRMMLWVNQSGHDFVVEEVEYQQADFEDTEMLVLAFVPKGNNQDLLANLRADPEWDGV